MKNSEYWKLRFEQLEQAQNQKGTDTFAEIEKQYRQAQKEIEGKIAVWYQRLADNNNVSMAQARKMLAADELREFKWDVNDYIKYGEENALNGKWIKELENASAKYHISSLEELKIRTQQSLEVMFSKQLETVTDSMKNIFESGYYHTAYELQKGFNIGWDITGLNQSQIEKVLSKPWAVDGKNFSERIWGSKQKLINEVHNELSQNILLGADPQKAIDAISKKMNASKNNAGRLVMTEEAYFSSAAQKECFNELDVEQYEIVATIDSHTSEICQNLDGKVFPVKEFEPGVTAPPFHVYCRSTTVPYFDDDFGKTAEREARDKDGNTYYVPADMSYQEWKKTFAEGGSKEGLKKYKQVDNSGGSGIIKESSKKPITAITDKSIEKVQNVNITGYTDEQCKFIKSQHQELLKYSRDNNDNKEVAFVFDSNLSNRKEFIGSDDKLDFGSSLYGKDLFVMHNHPRNSSYSFNDVVEFIANDSIKTLTIVKNNGNIESLTKLFEIEKLSMLKELQRLEKNNIKVGSDSEYRKIVDKFLDKHEKGGFFEWKK
ncbi:minor capsid protein [Porcipelethomonas sp.]|uniref:minor capsid protein n=1 Tax=Porcipelethomonas sp. TaxID=2981675 RepID=UPI003EF92DB6